jgi:hypothetical protein
MRAVLGCDDAVARFVSDHITFGGNGGFAPCTAMGVANDEDFLVGGFVFHNYEPEIGVIEVSFAGTTRHWLTRPILYAAFSYVFNQLGCQLACSRTPASLRHACRIARAYGFKQVLVPRLFGRDEDGIISTLTVDDWRANGFHKENR